MEEDDEAENVCSTDETAENELLLDTKGACFFCLKENLIAGEKQEGSGMSKVCLRSICRYLEINPSSILFKSLQESLTNEEEQVSVSSIQNKYNFSVQLCSSCVAITNKLSELIHQVELVKLMMNYKVQEFYNVLSSAEEDKSESEGRWKKVHEKISDNPVELRLVEQLREETMKNCYKKLHHINKYGFPKVLLYRISAPLVTEDTEETRPRSAMEALEARENCLEARENCLEARENCLETRENCLVTESLTMDNKCDNNQSFTEENAKDDTATSMEVVMEKHVEAHVGDGIEDTQEVQTFDDQNAVQKASSNRPPNSKMFVLSTMSKHYKKLKFSNHHKCLLCNQVYFKKYSARHHILYKHPELIFTQCKRQNIPEETFHQLCMEFLATTSTQAKSIFPKQGKRSRFLPCPFCDKKFSHGRDLRHHACVEHYSKLKDKLVHLQDNIDQYNTTTHHRADGVKKLFNNKIKKINSKRRWNCVVANGGCGKSLSSSRALSKHKMEYCSKRKRRKIWTCSLATGGCGHLFTSKRSLRMHRTDRTLSCDGVKGGKTYRGTKSKVNMKSGVLNSQSNDKCAAFDNHVDGDDALEKDQDDADEIEITIEVDSSNNMISVHNLSVSGSKQNLSPPSNLTDFTSDSPIAEDEVDIEMDVAIPPVSFNSPTKPSNIIHEENNNDLSSAGQNLVKDTFAKYCERICSAPGRSVRHNCLVCDNLCGTVWSFQRHFMMKHPDKFFPHKRLNNLSEDMFKGCCAEMLNLILSQAERLEVSPNRKHILCPSCFQKCTDEHMVKCHLITKHYKLLEEELMNVQKDAILEREVPPVITGIYSCNTVEPTQQGCAATMQTVGTSLSSELKERPPTFYQSCLSENETLPIETLHDSEHFSAPRMPTAGIGASQVVVTTAEKENLEVVAAPTTNHEETMQNISLQQTLCSSSSQRESFEKVQKFVRDTCALHFKTTRNPDNFKCLICQQYHNNSKIRHHIVLCHPEKFFLHKKAELLSEEDFSVCCTQVLTKVTDKAEHVNRTRSHTQLFCPYCSLVFSDLYFLQYHLLLKHYSLLEDKIVESQEEQDWQQLDGCEEVLFI